MPRRTVLVALLLVGLPLLPRARAAEGIDWVKDLPGAFERAKAEQKILMICVNARFVKDSRKEEPAAKGLREVVYVDPRVIERSKEFVCALLTAEGSAEDYGELRLLGIDGDLVSPQHIFVHPDGTSILVRKEYWSYGQGEPAVEALLDMMDRAKAKLAGGKEVPDEGAGPGPAPEGDGRSTWIEEQVRTVVEEEGKVRAGALAALLAADRDGDCSDPLIALLTTQKKDEILLEAVIRALGRDGLDRAAEPLTAFLGHRNERLRGNAAVSLEYIGSRDKEIVDALRKAVGKEKEEYLANHMYRALGRCGVDDAKVRALLLKKAEAGKSEFATYGPGIGLAYFEQDEKARRGVEKILKKLGIPGGRRGGGANGVKRGVLSWTLACIGDAKSAAFVREELIARLENVQAFWVDGMRGFWSNVAQACDGDRSVLPAVVGGVRVIVDFARRFDMGRYGAETRSLMDECRLGRDNSTFTPLGDHLLEAGEGG